MALANLKELQTTGFGQCCELPERELRSTMTFRLTLYVQPTWKSLISHVSESRRKGKLLLTVDSLGALATCSEHIKSVLCSSVCSRPMAMRSQRFR